jgi:F420-non-reducing hydrogenase small subunit
MTPKGKMALYWATSCGGCDIAVLALHEHILDVAEHFDILFWPCVLDGKKKDVKALADQELDVCLFNGAIRNDENEEMALLLRQKAKVLIAFGSCAHEGCIPGLANFSNRKQMMDYIFHQAPSVLNETGTEPSGGEKQMPEGTIHLPDFWNTVKTLDQVVEVDYTLPGCPPEAPRIWEAVQAIVSGELPAKGSVLGAKVTVCDECTRTKKEKKISASTGLMKSCRMSMNACWNRESSAPVSPRAAAAGLSAPR